jgi:beta-lactamase class A
MPPVRQRRRRPPSLMLHVTRLVILGVGIGAIAGTMLAILNPTARQGEMAETTRSLLSGSQPVTTASGTATALNPQPIRPIALQMGEPMTELASRIQALTAQYDGLTPGVFLMDMDTGAYLDLNGTSIFATASMVKVPILVAFLQDVDAGKIQLDEPLTMKPEDIAEGSGEMQYEPAGTQFTALETASEMITISDNTATNMIIARLGGAAALNQRFREWGLTNTMIRNLLPDLEGTNTTTPKELTELMARVSQGDLLSLRSRDRLFEIMRQTVTNTLLPAGLAPEATVAHKTGDIGSLVGDVGMIDAPNGKRYVITVMVQRPHNDDRAQELIRQISRETYAYLTQPIAATLEPAAE